MHKTYTPGPCKGDDAQYEGQVVLKVPAYEERLEMIADHPEILEQGKGGEDPISRMRTVLAMVKWSYNFYEKVDLKRRSDGHSYKCLDDLRFDMGCQGIIQDVAVKLAQGFELGES